MNILAHPKHHSPRDYPDIRCDEDGNAIGSLGYGEGHARRWRRRKARIAACDRHLADLVKAHAPPPEPEPEPAPPRQSEPAQPEAPLEQETEMPRRRGVLLRPNFDEPEISSALSTIALRAAMVREYSPGETPRVLIFEIIAVVSVSYGLSPGDLSGKGRWPEYIRPRHVAMYLGRLLTKQSLSVVGRAFGHADHTTVLHAATSIGRALLADPDLAADLLRLIELLECALCHA